MPNWCSIKISIDFPDSEEITKFEESFKKHLTQEYEENKFIYENEEKDIGIAIFDLEYEVYEKNFEITYGQTRWNFHGENLKAFVDYLLKFNIEKGEILFAEQGMGFIGKHEIRKKNEYKNECKKILDKLLINNEKSLSNNILKYIKQKYIVEEVFYKENVCNVYRYLDDTPVEELQKYIKEKNFFTDYEGMTQKQLIDRIEDHDDYDWCFGQDQEEKWFNENDLYEYHRLWCGSG